MKNQRRSHGRRPGYEGGVATGVARVEPKAKPGAGLRSTTARVALSRNPGYSTPGLLNTRATQHPGYFRNSGRSQRGRISGISGQTIIAARTTSIGTSMIIVSFSA